MRGAFKTNDGWFEAKRKGSKGSSKESSLKSSASTASANSGLQVEKMKKIIREEGTSSLGNIQFHLKHLTKDVTPEIFFITMFHNSLQGTAVCALYRSSAVPKVKREFPVLNICLMEAAICVGFTTRQKLT